MPFRHVAICLAVLALAVFAGCDAAPGVEDASSSPPILSEFEYDPAFVTLAALPDEDVTADSVRFDVQFSVRAQDADATLESVVYVVRAPDSQAPAVASGTVMPTSTGRYEAVADVRIARGRVGNYTLLVYALDDRGRMSNTHRGLITFTAEGRPPVIVEIVAVPETIDVSRDSTLTLTAVVDDPDGLANIARVVVRTPNGQDLDMIDDGRSHGDEVAGDGRYNARFGNVNLATPGTTQTFSFQAFDRTGLASEIVEKAIRIE